MFEFESIIIRDQHNRHFHVFILECSPFNFLEWLTRSCLWQRYHLLFVCILTTWDRVVEILSHTPSKNWWPGIKTIEEIVIHLSKTWLKLGLQINVITRELDEHCGTEYRHVQDVLWSLTKLSTTKNGDEVTFAMMIWKWILHWTQVGKTSCNSLCRVALSYTKWQ